MRKLHETKLCSRNLIKGINTWDVPLVRKILSTILEMDEGRTSTNEPEDKKTNNDAKGLTSERWETVSRNEEGRGPTNIEDSVDASIPGLEDYNKKNKERLITATRNSTDNINRTAITKTTEMRYFKQLTDEISYEKICIWLRKGNLKRSWISSNSNRNNPLRTNYVKAKTDKMQQNSKCRLCGDRDETFNKRKHQTSAERVQK